MNIRRGLLTWSALAVCAALVIGAMVWLTRGVLAAERERARAQAERVAADSRADLEERTRLALWRMDAQGATVMLRENRLTESYYTRSTPTGTLTTENPEVLLHFEVRKDGEPVSPEPPGQDQERMKRLRSILADNPLPGDEWAQVNRAVDEGEVTWNALPKEALREEVDNSIQRLNQNGGVARQEQSYQTNSNITERAKRAKALANTVQNDSQEARIPHPATKAADALSPADSLSPKATLSMAKKKSAPGLAEGEIVEEKLKPAAEVTPLSAAEVGPMRCVWLGNELFLLRKVTRRQIPSPVAAPPGWLTQSVVQGVWLDPEVLRSQLLKEVSDLLPAARLIPVSGGHAVADPLTMVSFPFRLERNETVEVPPIPPAAGFGAPLWVAWGAVATAILTSTLLVRGVMRLSERRASFVSAVTHELRTPLTTFRLYSDMLESGAVKEEKRGNYLRVLSREADRLSHLVENVLAFSRIERGTARSNVRETRTGDMLETFRERFEARLATAGLALVMDCTSNRVLRIDTAAVEHILFNLLDNAAKYAASGSPPTVEISVCENAGTIDIFVRDHGPGIARAERARVFQAFHKSAREAAETKPGVGLGLALSRRLARELGGDLESTGDGPGACFRLRLPL